MSDFESRVRIDIDAGQALASIKALQRQISDFHTSLAKGSATANLKSLQMQQSLIDTINATGQYSAQMKTVASSTQAFTTALEKNKFSLNQYFRYAGGASKSFGKFFKTEMDTVTKVAIERVKDLQTQYIKMGRDANGALKTIAVRPLALDMENLATKTQIAAQKQQLLNQLLKQGSTNLLNFGKNTQWAGRQLMVGFTIPLGILGTTAAKTFMDMEKQAISFKRVYGDTFTASSETDKMLKQVQQLSSEFTKYGIAVEKTMETAAKAAATGKMGADLLAQVSESTRLSVLGNVEQQKALETTISLTNAFGTAADELRGKINFLNAVENQTVTSIEDLTTAIPKAAPVIKQLGGNVEDLAFFLTAMREGGINASEGANALKSGLASLINPTNKATKMLQGFGINITSIVEKNKGDVKNLVIDFAKALDTLDPLNRARAIEQLFGKFQFSRLSTLFQNVIKDGSQATRVLELTKQSAAELGILAQRELNKISASPMYKFQKAIADFKKELAPVGEEFLKAVTPLINFGTDILKSFNKLDGGVKQFIINTTGVIAGLGPIFLMTFGLIANGVANVIKGFTFVKNIFNKASTASTILGETTDYMTQQQIEAAAVAASLEQVHNKLTQAFTVEAGAINNLTAAYQKAVSAQTAFTGASVGKRAPRAKKYADGVFSVPGPKGAGDIVPAMLSPGEAVIPAKPAAKYRGFIKNMIAGKIPGFSQGTEGLGNEKIDWSKIDSVPGARKTLLKSYEDKLRSAPDAFKKEKDAMTWTTKDKEIKYIHDALVKQGIKPGSSLYNQFTGIDASHIMPEKTSVDIGGRKFQQTRWKSANLTADVGVVNKFLSYISDKFRKQEFKAESLKSLVGKSMTVAQIQKEIDLLAKGRHVTTPQSMRVLKAITQQIESGQVKSALGTKRAASIVGGIADMRLADKSKGGFFGGFENRKFSQAAEKAAERTQISRVKSLALAAKNLGSKSIKELTQLVEDKKATKATRRAERAENDATKERVKTAKQEKRAAVAKGKKAKIEESNAKKTTPKKVTKEVPAVTQSEKIQLENGITKYIGVDSRGRAYTQYRDANNKLLKNAEAQRRMVSGRGAATRPGGRIRGLLTGLPGKLGLAGLATMGAGAVTGDQNVSNISDQLFQAAMLSSFIPQGTISKIGGRIKKSSIYQKVAGSKIGQAASRRIATGTEAFNLFKAEAATSVAAKGIAKSLPMLATGLLRVGTKFIPVIGQILLALDVAYTVLTMNAKKQAEISQSIIETLSVTQDRLDKVNEFFGTDAKLGGIKSATVGSGAVVGEKASLAEQFRQSEQFASLYKDQAAKLKDATDQQFAITMQSLAIDLHGQGVGEEQIQIIIDAIKKEAGKTNVVINFKDLRIDTETGRKNLAKSLKEITQGAIKEYQSDRNFLGLNWEANIKLDEYGAQVGGFISGLSQEFVKGTISVEEYNSSFQEIKKSADELNAANPGDGLLFLKNTMMQTNPELAAGMAGISDLTIYAKAMDVAMKGAALSTEFLADAASSIPEIQAKAKKYLDELDAFYSKKNADLRKQSKIITGLTNQQKQLQKQEQSINDTYDERIKALERINDLQQQISKQKQGELDLADALSRGDTAAAARIVQQMRADQASLALQQQKNALEDQKNKTTGAIQDKQDAISNSIDSANQTYQNIADRQPPAYKPTDYGKYMAAYIEQAYKAFGWIWGLTHFWMSEADKKALFNEQMTQQTNAIISFFPGLFQTKASGGHIKGPGTGTSDSIPAMLSNGEYVIRANAVKAIGTDTLDRLNYADKNKFAYGGMVKSSPQFPEGTAINRDAASWKTPMDYIVDFFGWIGSLFNQPKKIELPKVHKVPLNPIGPSTPKIKKETKQYFGYADGGQVDPNNPMSIVGAGLSSVMGGIYENLFGGWFNNLRSGKPTAPTAEDYGTMAMNSFAIPGLGKLGKLGKVGKLFSKTPRQSTLHTPAFKKYQDKAIVKLMRSNPRIAVRMPHSDFIDTIGNGKLAYQNRYELGRAAITDAESAKQASLRLQIEKNIFGIPENAPGSARPIYGAAVDATRPWSIRGKERSDQRLADYFLRGNYTNVMTKHLDRYGDIALLLKKRVNKRSKFTIGDSYSANNFAMNNPSIPARFGTMSQSRILAAQTGNYLPELKFIEAQIFGGLPFKDVKKILVKNPDLIPMLQQELQRAGLKIPVGMPGLNLKGKLLQRFYKNKTYKHNGEDTGLSMFVDSGYPKYAKGGMVKGYKDGGQSADINNPMSILSAGLNSVMDGIYQNLFGGWINNLRHGNPTAPTAEDALIMGLNAAPIPGFKAIKAGAAGIKGLAKTGTIAGAKSSYLSKMSELTKLAPKGKGIDKISGVRALANPNLSLAKSMLTGKLLHGTSNPSSKFNIKSGMYQNITNPNWFNADFFTTGSKDLAATYGSDIFKTKMPITQAFKSKILDLYPGAPPIEQQFPGITAKLEDAGMQLYSHWEALANTSLTKEPAKLAEYLSNPRRHMPFTDNDAATKILKSFGIDAIRHQSGHGVNLYGTGVDPIYSEVFAFLNPKNMQAKKTGINLRNVVMSTIGSSKKQMYSNWTTKSIIDYELKNLRLKLAKIGNPKINPFYKEFEHVLGDAGPEFATGGLVGIPKFKAGGMFRTPYANGGLAMLHDKEFVMNAQAVKDYGINNLKAMNNGTYNGGSVYNSYGVNINVGGSNSNANDIARTVIREIKRLDSQNIRSTRV